MLSGFRELQEMTMSLFTSFRILFTTEMFQDRIISRNSDFEWPPRSPDLTASDFWLWGYL